MVKYIVTYNINAPLRLRRLQNMIQREAGWARLNANTYIVDSDDSAVQLRDRLKGVLVNGDSLFVGELHSPTAWIGLNEEVSNWIRKNM